MQVIRSHDIDPGVLLQRLDAVLLNGESLPEEEQEMPAPQHFVEMAPAIAPDADAIKFDAVDEPAPPRKARGNRFVGTLTVLVGLVLLGATFLSGGKFDNFAASASTVTAAIGQHLTKGL